MKTLRGCIIKHCQGALLIKVKHFDFDDADMYDRVVKNSNVVINLVGPR